MHIGSQVFVAENFAHAVETVAELAREVALPELCVGGGLGVAYVAGEEAPSLTEWADAIHDVAKSAGIDARITAEPGRSIVAQAGMTLYTVGTIKEIPDVRTYVSVDGGMSDNPRPVLYGSGYETFLPRAADADRPRTIRLVGKHCESGDLLVRKGRVPADLAVGDVLCTPVTGAYGHSMGSNYNKVPRPRWCSSPTVTPASWCAARPTTISFGSTSGDPRWSRSTDPQRPRSQGSQHPRTRQLPGVPSLSPVRDAGSG